MTPDIRLFRATDQEMVYAVEKPGTSGGVTTSFIRPVRPSMASTPQKELEKLDEIAKKLDISRRELTRKLDNGETFTY